MKKGIKKKTKPKAVKKAIKKPAKKKAAKKEPKVEVTITRKILGKAPEEYHFVLQDGRKLGSIYELIDELETMHADLFKHHVNETKNDFANWIEHTFNEKSLAEELRELENNLDMQRAILKEMVRKLIAKK